MKIVQIVSGMYIVSAGPSYSIARLSDVMLGKGNDVSIVTSGRMPDAWPYKTGIEASSGLLDNTLSVSPGLVRKVRKLSRSVDIIHGHSMWRFANNVFPLVLDRNSRAKVVCSPRGTISAWSMRYKSFIKKPFWKLVQKPAMERCDCFHVTAEPEYEAIRQAGLAGPVAVIANGIDMPELLGNGRQKKQVLFLGRIDPVKGLENLVDAWTHVSNRRQDWELVIAGPLDSAYARSLQDRVRGDRLPGISFVGEVHGEKKRRLLREASLFVLPSFTENFGMVVVEALAHGTPVITTTGTPWSELEDRGCGWQVEPEAGALMQAMDYAMSLPDAKLAAFGGAGRRWMSNQFSWPGIADQMLHTYEWVCGQKERPDWSMMD